MEQKIKVVIVEDDPMVMEVNKQFVEDTGGFNIVGTAQSGTKALSIIAELQPDLVILDIFLPDMGGLETLVELRKQNQPIDVILVTAARDSETIQSVFRYGAIDYIVKPFRFERFKSALESYKLMRSNLSKDVLNQDEIDRLTSVKTFGQADNLSLSLDEVPKGLNAVTLKQVLLYLLKQKEPRSAEEVAEGVGLARVTARRYLDYLEKSGKVRLEIQYGTIGRPINRYYIDLK
ncbi:response regulator [Ectobacillus panaciterrae]|uniref:response regulator n=1 Tax=Ectobacillus panaciterrae TaxID=363872 RepID=UPI000422FFA2|nr:response regulator [Ectobacillus panaciterrae]